MTSLNAEERRTFLRRQVKTHLLTVARRIRQGQIVARVMTETRSTQKERSLLAHNLDLFANQASLLISGFGSAETKHHTANVLSRLELSPGQIRRMKAILVKRGESRSFPEAEFLADMIRKLRVCMLSSLTEPELTLLMTSVEGLEVNAGDPVFNIGDPGSHFYVVCSGILGVFIRPPNATNNDKPLVQVGTLSSGRGFGERSLLDNENRKATVCAFQQSLLLCIDKRSFTGMIKSLFDRQLDLKIQFFSSLPLCKHWSRREILRFGLPFETCQLRRGDVVTKQGELHKTLDIVRDGYLIVQRKVHNDHGGRSMVVQLCSIGRGILIEPDEAVNNRPCSNTITCSLQSSATIYTVLCSDLIAALKASPKVLISLKDHISISHQLSEANFLSACAGTLKREIRFTTQLLPQPTSCDQQNIVEPTTKRNTSSEGVVQDNNQVDKRQVDHDHGSCSVGMAAKTSMRIASVSLADGRHTRKVMDHPPVLPEPYQVEIAIDCDDFLHNEPVIL